MRSCAIEVRLRTEALKKTIGDAITQCRDGGLLRSTAARMTESIVKLGPPWMELLAKKMLIDTRREVEALTAETSMSQWADTLDLAERLAGFGKIGVDRKLLKSASDVVKDWSSPSSAQAFSKPRSVPVGGDDDNVDKLMAIYGAKKNLLEWCTKHNDDFPDHSELIAGEIKEALAELDRDSPLSYWIWSLNRSKTLSLLEGTGFGLDTRIPEVTRAVEWRTQPNYIDGGDPVDVSVLDDVKAELTNWFGSRKGHARQPKGSALVLAGVSGVTSILARLLIYIKV